MTERHPQLPDPDEMNKDELIEYVAAHFDIPDQELQKSYPKREDGGYTNNLSEDGWRMIVHDLLPKHPIRQGDIVEYDGERYKVARDWRYSLDLIPPDSEGTFTAGHDVTKAEAKHCRVVATSDHDMIYDGAPYRREVENNGN